MAVLKPNLTISEGYLARNAETAVLLRDLFVRTPRIYRCNDIHTDKKDSGKSKVCSWSPDPAKLNSTFSRVARNNLPSAPASRSINQDTLRHWQRSAREQTFRLLACLDASPRYRTPWWHSLKPSIWTRGKAKPQEGHSKL